MDLQANRSTPPPFAPDDAGTSESTQKSIQQVPVLPVDVNVNESISININIDDYTKTKLAKNAIKTLKTKLADYAKEIVKEAALLEEGNREEGDDPEITSNHINQSVRKYRTKKKRKWTPGVIALRILSSLSMMSIGFLVDTPAGYNQQPWKLYVCLLVVLIASATTVADIILETKE